MAFSSTLTFPRLVFMTKKQFIFFVNDRDALKLLRWRLDCRQTFLKAKSFDFVVIVAVM